MARQVEVVPYDPAWPERFRVEAPRVAAALGANVLAVHHMGSTAIPGIHAKPTIDLLVEVQDIEQVEGRNAAIAALGYQARGENGTPGRRYFVKAEGDVHLFHVHVFERGHGEIKRHLNFRDYIIAHPDEAQAYGELKAGLAQQFRHDPESYTDSKTAFVQAIDEQARRWFQQQANDAS